MKKINNKLDVRFFCNKLGHEPVREWLKKLTKPDKKIIGEDIKMVQFGWPLGMPLVRYLSKGLWEIRSKLSTSRIARTIFFIYEHYMILTHAFIKKTKKTPSDDLNLALKRKKLLEQACK